MVVVFSDPYTRHDTLVLCGMKSFLDDNSSEVVVVAIESAVDRMLQGEPEPHRQTKRTTREKPWNRQRQDDVEEEVEVCWDDSLRSWVE